MHDFINNVKELIALFQQMIPLEQQKLEAARDDNMIVIEDCMIKEQASVLRLKGLENEREKLQEQLGVKGKTFRQILERFPEEAGELQPLFSELTAQIKMFGEINEGANTLLRTNIFRIENAIREKEGGIYSATGSPMQGEQHFTNRKA